jgi:O-antigen ligase
MATMSLSAALLAVTFFLTSLSVKQIAKEWQQSWKTPPFRIYFIVSFFLMLACAISLLNAKISPLTFGGLSSQIHFFKDLSKTWYLFWPLLLVLGLKRLSSSDHKFILHTWLGAFAIMSIIGIVQHYTGWPRPQQIPYENRYHATLFLGHHLSVASILIFPFFAALEFTRRFRNDKNKRILYGTITLLGGITLLLTYSRTLWIALPCGLILWTFLSLSKKWKLISSGIAIAGLLAASQIPFISHHIFDSRGLGTRQQLWSTNLEFFKQRPWFGVGLRHNQELSGYYLMDLFKSQDVFSGHAHNNLIDMLGGIGGVGTLCWVAWCLCIFYLFLRKKGPSELIQLKRAFLCAWVVFQINGLTQLNFWEAKVQHQLAWVIAWALL